MLCYFYSIIIFHLECRYVIIVHCFHHYFRIQKIVIYVPLITGKLIYLHSLGSAEKTSYGMSVARLFQQYFGSTMTGGAVVVVW
jgi:hypothetical protein